MIIFFLHLENINPLRPFSFSSKCNGGSVLTPGPGVKLRGDLSGGCRRMKCTKPSKRFMLNFGMKLPWLEEYLSYLILLLII